MNRPVGLQWPGRKRHLPPAVDVGLTPLLRLPGTLADRGAVRLIRGEALQVAERLLHEGLRGHIDVIHLDPPFGSQVDYARLRDLRIIGADGTPRTIPLQLPAYGDTDADDLAGYLDDLEPVLQRCRELLSARGSLYVHLDFRRGPYVRMLLDELFGADHLVNEIVWAYGLGGSSATRFQRKHDILYFYARDLKHHWFRAPQQAATSSLLLGQPKRATDVWVTEGREDEDRIVNDWPDALVEKTLSNRDPERTGYPTQKPLALAMRLVQASLPPGGLACDLMSGSGTFGVAAALLGRDAILGDRSDIALDTARGRLVNAGAAVTLQALATCVPAVRAIDVRVRVDLLQVHLDGAEVPEVAGISGPDALSAWGLCRDDGQGLVALAWWDGGAGRLRPEVPRALAYSPGQGPLTWLGIDVAGQWYRCDLS